MAEIEVTPVGSSIVVEIIERKTERESSITGFQFKDPEFQGPPIMGRVYSMPMSEKEFKCGDLVVFGEPNPPAFDYGGKKLMVVPRDQIKALVNEL